MKEAILFLVSFWVAALFALDKVTPSLAPIRISDTSAVLAQLEHGKLVVFGQEWEAEKYCNASTLAHPERLELYGVNESDVMVILCPGEENVVTVFFRDQSPRSRRVKPIPGSAKISSEVLRNSIIRLTRP